MDILFADITGWSLLKIAAIPFISGIVGWLTNVLALKMTFYPLEFVGIKRFGLGWQGIIPSKATKMASKSVDMMTSKLIKVETVFSRMEPMRVAEEMGPAMQRLTHDIIEETMREEAPLIWDNAPALLKRRIYQRASEDLPDIIELLMREVKNEITDLFDLKGMVVEALEHDKPLLNHIFLKVGEKEFRFIERSGFYFGFAFGIVQAVMFFFFQSWWILPLFGLLVGWATNWLALRLIFEPQEPKRYFGFVVQGLFIKRQKEVAQEYAKIIAERILTTQNIFENMIQGPASDRLIEMVARQVKHAVDMTAGLSRPLYQLAQGTKRYDRIKEHIADRFVEELPGSIRHMFRYAEQSMAVEETLRDKMIALSPTEFEGFLRPVFQEDEAKLIAVGAALGAIAGFAQLLLF
ncbi:MAG: DUF445 domain-containing protein [Bacteroidia bacterium]